jgi:cation diffusion facilitator family transporter
MSQGHTQLVEKAREARPAPRGEQKTRWVLFIALFAMAAEIAVGLWSGSLALLTDGWHMATHVGALGLCCLAYWYARRAHGAGRFAFGPGKVATLAGFANAIILGVIAILMLVEAVERLASPQPVRFAEALPVALVDLLVNIASAWLLSPDHAEDHHDHNLRAAYLHVLADALTSVLAISALAFGYFTSTARLDAIVAMVGAVVILWWAVGLLRTSIPELVDVRLEAETVVASLRKRLECDGLTSVKEVRLWPLGSGRKGCQLGLVTGERARSRSIGGWRSRRRPSTTSRSKSTARQCTQRLKGVGRSGLAGSVSLAFTPVAAALDLDHHALAPERPGRSGRRLHLNGLIRDARHAAAVDAHEMGVPAFVVHVAPSQLEPPRVVSEIRPRQEPGLGQIAQVPVDRRVVEPEGLELARDLLVGHWRRGLLHDAQDRDPSPGAPETRLADAVLDVGDGGGLGAPCGCHSGQR